MNVLIFMNYFTIFLIFKGIPQGQSSYDGGSLGGNPSVETGAVNVSVGKCTQYKLDVKTALNAGKQVSSVTVPKGCEAIKEK